MRLSAFVGHSETFEACAEVLKPLNFAVVWRQRWERQNIVRLSAFVGHSETFEAFAEVLKPSAFVWWWLACLVL